MGGDWVGQRHLFWSPLGKTRQLCEFVPVRTPREEVLLWKSPFHRQYFRRADRAMRQTPAPFQASTTSSFDPADIPGCGDAGSSTSQRPTRRVEKPKKSMSSHVPETARRGMEHVARSQQKHTAKERVLQRHESVETSALNAGRPCTKTAARSFHEVQATQRTDTPSTMESTEIQRGRTHTHSLLEVCTSNQLKKGREHWACHYVSFCTSRSEAVEGDLSDRMSV